MLDIGVLSPTNTTHMAEHTGHWCFVSYKHNTPHRTCWTESCLLKHNTPYRTHWTLVSCLPQTQHTWQNTLDIGVLSSTNTTHLTEHAGHWCLVSYKHNTPHRTHWTLVSCLAQTQHTSQNMLDIGVLSHPNTTHLTEHAGQWCLV